MDDFYEREFWDTADRLELYVACPKSLGEFVSSLDAVVNPLTFKAGSLSIGAITLSCSEVSVQPPLFTSLPAPHYTNVVALDGPDPFGFWGALHLLLVVPLSSCIRTKFSCHYLALLDGRGVLFYSGTNEPCLVNERWPGHEAYSGLLGAKRVTRLDIPLAPDDAAA